MFIDGVIAAGLTTGITTAALTTSPFTSGQITTSPLTTNSVTTVSISTGSISTGSISTGSISTGSISTGSISTGSVTTNRLTTSFLTTGGTGYPITPALIYTSLTNENSLYATQIGGSPVTTIPTTTTTIDALFYNQLANSTTLVYLDINTGLFRSYNLIQNVFQTISSTPFSFNASTQGQTYTATAPNGTNYGKLNFFFCFFSIF
jgi:hypothetical protein